MLRKVEKWVNGVKRRDIQRAMRPTAITMKRPFKMRRTVRKGTAQPVSLFFVLIFAFIMRLNLSMEFSIFLFLFVVVDLYYPSWEKQSNPQNPKRMVLVPILVSDCDSMNGK
jgi:hypothetical protein